MPAAAVVQKTEHVQDPAPFDKWLFMRLHPFGLVRRGFCPLYEPVVVPFEAFSWMKNIHGSETYARQWPGAKADTLALPEFLRVIFHLLKCKFPRRFQGDLSMLEMCTSTVILVGQTAGEMSVKAESLSKGFGRLALLMLVIHCQPREAPAHDVLL